MYLFLYVCFCIILHHPQVGKHLKRLWSGTFRVMDDIKETVRISGEKLCRAVTSLTTRLCDVSLTDMSDAHKAMDIVLPFLLAEGILSKVDSVRKASIAVVMKLTKVRNVLLGHTFSTCVLHSFSFCFSLIFLPPDCKYLCIHISRVVCSSNLIELCRDVYVFLALVFYYLSFCLLFFIF